MVFISHAGEDKGEVARPLAQLLRDRGLAVWLDEDEIFLGDSLRERIDHGSQKSDYGVVILSSYFFAKDWPEKELDALFAQETLERRLILPVRHGISHEEVANRFPLLAARLSVGTDRGLDHVANEIERAIRRVRPSQETQTKHEQTKNDLKQNLYKTNPKQHLSPSWFHRHRVSILASSIGAIVFAIVLAFVLKKEPTPAFTSPLFRLVPFNYVVKDSSEGWKEGQIALAFINTSGHMLDYSNIPTLTAGAIVVKTEEGKEYDGQVINAYGSPVSINLSGRDGGDNLPIPPNLPHWITHSDYMYISRGKKKPVAYYWIRFRFAGAAHPKEVKVRFTPASIIENSVPELVIDLSSISDAPPAYQVDVDNVKSIDVLQKILSFDKPDKIQFQVSNKCMVERTSRQIYLSYSAVNHNRLDQETETIEFGYALWFPYGAWLNKWQRLNLQLGPGQRVEGKIVLGPENPQYLILYEPIGTYRKYEDVSIYSLQCAYE